MLSPNCQANSTASGSSKYAILIADPDPRARRNLAQFVESAGFTAIEAPDGRQAIEQMHPNVTLALLDANLTGISGLECSHHIHNNWPTTETVVMTSANQLTRSANEQAPTGCQIVPKPIRPTELSQWISQSIASKAQGQHDATMPSQVIPPSSPPQTQTQTQPRAVSHATLELNKQIHCVAKLDSTILITGESGTGKTTIARQIHENGPRAQHPFVAVNCASLPRDLIESELFGHAKGAFTGAVGERPGHIEIANGGTLLLDEIGELPLELQPKLLTILQDRKIRRIGSTQEIAVNVRVIAATHCDLEAMCRNKQFREDLFYRLNVLRLATPPVRNRKEDIPGLIHQILKRLATRHRVSVPRVEPEAMRMLVNYSWPGNIREMENILERVIVFLGDSEIRVKDLDLLRQAALRNMQTQPANGSMASASNNHSETCIDSCYFNFRDPDDVKTLAEVEQLAIEAALAACNGNKAKTALRLGISEKSIYNKMRRHGMR